MYHKILVALDNTPTDAVMLSHLVELAQMCRAELLLAHVADGFAARQYHELNLCESEEMEQDRAYLERTAEALRSSGLTASIHLALGDPATELLKLVKAEACDLIAMTSHGHQLLADLVHGSTIDKVRHKIDVPMFIVRTARVVKRDHTE